MLEQLEDPRQTSLSMALLLLDVAHVREFLNTESLAFSLKLLSSVFMKYEHFT